MIQFEIIYEDEDLMVINKPAKILSIPDRYIPEKPNLKDLLSEKKGRIFTVHRLDKDTSGIICFAKNEEAHQSLSLQFENRTVEKYYQSIVEGRVLQTEGRIEQPIAADPNKPGKMIISRKGKASITEYEMIEQFKNFSLLSAKILTGRTHQIRVHFSFIGHPLAIDPIYGKREAFFLSEIKRKRYRLGKNQEERPLISRLTLHAQQLKLNHPITKERLTFEAEFPKDLRAMVNQLKKWNK